MRVTIFTLPCQPDHGFDTTALDDFCRDHDVLACRDHFFISERGPTLGLVVEFRDRPKSHDWGRSAPTPDRREEIAPENRPLFDALRNWRSERAKREGKPHYVYFRNPELSEIAVKRPLTAAALREIAGVGEAKVASYGEEILALVRQMSQAAVEPAAQPPAPADPGRKAP